MATLTSPAIEDLITNVRNMLNQPDPNNSFWGDEELAVYLNEAIRRYFTEVVINAEGQFTTTADLDIVADTETVDLPSDFFSIKAVYRKITDGYVILPYLNNLNQSYSTAASDGGTYFPAYYFRGNKLVLRPGPGFAETAGIKIEYVQFPDTMLMGGDSLTAQISPVFRDLIEMYAVYKAKLKESLVNGTMTYGPAMENVNSLFAAFQSAVTPRSNFPTHVQPFSPEDN